MSHKIQLKDLRLGIPILMMMLLVLLLRTELIQNAPKEIYGYLLLDLLVTIPVIYFLLIRKTKIPKFTIVYPFLIGIFIGSYIIPIEHQQLLSKIKFIAIPIIELGIVSMIIYKMVSLNSSLRKTKVDDFYDKLLIASNEVFPNRIGKILATELAVIYYFFAFTSKKDKVRSGFTYFKKSGIQTVIGVVLFLVLIETTVVHLLVAQWNATIAWILSFLGGYTIIQIIAILRSMNQRLITIDYETKNLNLRYGFGSQTSIPFNSIKKIEKNRKFNDDDKSNIHLSLFDMLDTINITIHLNNENTLHKIYGMEKKYKSISLFIDEIDVFVDTIEKVIESEIK